MGMLTNAEKKLDKVVSLLEELVSLFKDAMTVQTEYEYPDGKKVIARAHQAPEGDK